MTKIIVFSDTHVPVMVDDLPRRLLDEAKKFDLCLHAGDFIEYSVFKDLSKVVKTFGVCGNMDGPDISKKLSQKQIVEVEQVKIGLIHGRGAPSAVPGYVRQMFESEWGQLDAVVFGHSHNALNELQDGKLFFNPGSAVDEISAEHPTYGVLEVDGKTITGKIVKLT
jgi:uncharacterized protein